MQAGVDTTLIDRSIVDTRSDHHRWPRASREWATFTRCVGDSPTIELVGFCVFIAVVTIAAVIQTIPIPSALAIVVLTPAALVDLRRRRLPDLWVVGAGAVFTASFVVGSLVLGSGSASGSATVTRTVIAGAVVMAGPLLVVHLSSPAAMGFGDVKAAVVLGAAAGVVSWELSLIALALAAGVTAAIGVIRRVDTMPLGPGLVAATAIALVGHGVIGR